MFLSRNKKNKVYPCKPQFYYIKVGFKRVKIIKVCFRDDKAENPSLDTHFSLDWLQSTVTKSVWRNPRDQMTRCIECVTIFSSASGRIF